MPSTISKMIRAWTGASKFMFGERTVARTAPMHRNLFNRSPPANEESGFVIFENQKRRLFYKKIGNGPNVLLCLPGALGTVDTDFWPQLKYFNKENYTIIGWDPPGYGKSRPPQRDFSSVVQALYDDARLVHAMMQALQLEHFSVLGWSEGGRTAIILAALFPESVEKLVVWGSGTFVTKEDVERYELIRDIKYWSPKVYENIVKMYGEEYFQRAVNMFIESYTKVLADGGTICNDQLSKIVCPTIVLHGMKDQFIDRSHVEYIVNRIPRSKMYFFPQGRHNFHLTQFEDFNYLVDDFIMGRSRLKDRA